MSTIQNLATPGAQKKFRNPLMGNHLSSITVSLVVNTILIVLLLVFIKFNEAPGQTEFSVTMMEMDETDLEDIQEIEEMIEPEEVQDEMTEVLTVNMDPMSETLDSSIPQETSIASDIVSPVSLQGLAQAMGGVNLKDVAGGLKGSTQFMGQSADGTRFVFVIDYSKSMSRDQLKVMKHELYSAVEKIGENGLVSLIFFSGPVWRPDQDGGNKAQKTGAHARWTGSNGRGWVLREGAEPPNPKWLLPHSRNLAALKRLIYQTPTTLGTDWFPPLNEALSMRPAPDIIFFMTDGASSQGSQDRALEMVRNLPPKSVQINTVVLGISEDKATALKEIAEITEGNFKHYGDQELKDVANSLPDQPTEFKDFELGYLSMAEVQNHMSASKGPALPPPVEEDLVEFEL